MANPENLVFNIKVQCSVSIELAQSSFWDSVEGNPILLNVLEVIQCYIWRGISGIDTSPVPIPLTSPIFTAPWAATHQLHLLHVLISDHRLGSLDEEEQNLFIDVDCKHPEPVMTPMPEGLTQQQVRSGNREGVSPWWKVVLQAGTRDYCRAARCWARCLYKRYG